MASRNLAIGDTSNLGGGDGAASAACDGVVDASGSGALVEHPPTMTATDAIANKAPPRNDMDQPYALQTTVSGTTSAPRTAPWPQ
jgi:hypothetical protein